LTAGSAAAAKTPKKPTAAQLVGTVAGSTRPGLTAAGLAKLTRATPAKLWVSLTGGSDAVPVDVRAQLLDGTKVVSSAVAQCVTLSSTPTKLSLKWRPFAAHTLKPGAKVALRVAAKSGTIDGSTPCGSADATAAQPALRVTFGSRKAPSSVGLTITPNATKTVYLHTPVGAVSLSESKPRTTRSAHKDSKPLDLRSGDWATAGTWQLPAQCACTSALLPSVRNAPAAPKPEPVTVTELPLPPGVATDTADACTSPYGCVLAGGGAGAGFQGGSYLPDGHEVTATAKFAGAPSSGPRLAYEGTNLIIVKTDGTTFPDGSPWKCLTCGVDLSHARMDHTDYPQAFADGMRVLWGLNVVQCDQPLADAACTPTNTHVYPVRWAGAAGLVGMREQRLHPDNVHIGFSGIDVTSAGFTEFSYYGRLSFNAATSTYDVLNVSRLYNPAATRQPIYVNPKNKKQLIWNPGAANVGELRGWTADGKEFTTIGNPAESGYTDVYAVNLKTGKIRRLSGNQQYVDPLDVSPNGKWEVEMAVAPSQRQDFLSGMHAIPPLTDLTTSELNASVRNNGNRRFFEPVLVDQYGGRGSYNGQLLNACSTPAEQMVPGSVCDPNWNGGADPRWSPDGTQVSYWQGLAVSPACGGANPLQCETSTEPGGRTFRLMVATFTTRKPVTITRPTAVAPDTVPWGTPVTTERPTPIRPAIPTGTYVLKGKVFGQATVTITDTSLKNAIATVAVKYSNYSDDGYYVLNGTEKTTKTFDPNNATVAKVDWYSNLKQSGCVKASKVTSANGFHVTIDVLTNEFDAVGTLTTTVNGRTYTQPLNNA
jgi:hypothetical protein